MTETSLHSEPAAIAGPSFGRIVRHVAGYSILIAVMLVSPLFVFLPAAIFQCTLRNGRRVTWLALFIGAMLAGGVVVAGASSPQISAAEAHMSVAYLVALILAVALPSMAVLQMVERGESFGRILITAVLFAAVGLGATEMAMRAGTGFSPFANQVHAFSVSVASVIDAYRAGHVPGDVIAFLQHWLNILVICLPAFLLVDAVLVFVLSLVLFGRMRTWRDVLERRQPSAPSPYLFRYLSLPDWLLFAFVAGGLSPLASGTLQQIGANVLAIVIFLYLLQGLAVFRWFMVASGIGFAGVLFAYIVLGVLALTGMSQLLLALTGLFDSFFDFRKFNRKDSSDESHLD
ncbi:MAG TPA: DUF2232 domain-containing protein [Thermoanaerobaculia bacterium]|nr:DUF2232 domain-containing protein [Thermoanaerobaculia bacterium]